MFISEYDTGEELAQFLRSNDCGRELVSEGASCLDFDHWDENPFGEWSEIEFDAVLEAAKHNTSVRTISINVELLLEPDGIRIAETISSIAQHMRGLQSVKIHGSGNGDPSPVQVFDILLRGIIKGEASVKSLSLSGPVSPGLFLKFSERFPDLESLALTPCKVYQTSQLYSDYTDFAIEVGVAVSRVLRSLRRVSLDFRRKQSSMTNLLSDLGGAASTTLKELHIVAGATTTNRLPEAVARFCALTKTLESLNVSKKYETSDPNLLDVTPMFRFWTRHPISDTIREIHLDWCELSASDALENSLNKLEVLRMNRSLFIPAPSLLKNLSRLKSLTFTYNDARQVEWGIDEGFETVDRRRGFLEDNNKLEILCETIERQDSSLDDIEIDLVGGYDGDAEDALSESPFERYAASERLLRACKGRLVVNFESLPMHSCHDIVHGLASLRGDLNELRVRFADCQFSDAHYGRILKVVQLSKSLGVFEFGLHERLTDQTISDIRDLVATNHTLHSLSLVGLGSDEAARLLDRVLPVLAAHRNMTLRSLQLHGVALTNSWPRLRRPMLSMLDKNRVLSQLDGCTIPLDDPTASRVRHLLKMNRYGRRFLPPNDDDNPPLPAGLWATILARIAHDEAHEVMRAFLQAQLVPLLHDSAYDPPPPPSLTAPPAPRRRSGRKRAHSEAA